MKEEGFLVVFPPVLDGDVDVLELGGTLNHKGRAVGSGESLGSMASRLE